MDSQVKRTKISKSTVLVGSVFLFLVGVVVISLASYFFGFNILRYPLQGSDSYNALTYITFLNKYFPKIPLWFPLQGAGESFMLGYPVLYQLNVVWLSRLAHIELLPSMSILNFATIILTALGVYSFVFYRLKNKIAAIIAGIFFLLSPFPYSLITGGGFLANAYADIFTIFAFIFFDAFLESYLKGEQRKKIIIYLIFSSVFFGLATLSHPVATLGFMVLMAIYFPLIGLLNFGKKGFNKSIGAFLILGFTVFLGCWFWFKPFTDYTNFSNRDLTFTADVSVLPPLSFASVLGLVKNGEPLLTNLSVPPVVWIFALIGGIISLFKKDKKVFVISLISFISMFLMGTHGFWFAVSNVNWLLGSFFGHRYYFTTTIILPPIAGAMGIWYLCELPFTKIKRGHFTNYFIISLVSILTLLVSVVAVLKLVPLSGYFDRSKPWILPYGDENYIDTTSIWSRKKPTVNYPCNYPEGDPMHNFRCDNEILAKYADIGMLINLCVTHREIYDTELMCLGGATVDGVFYPLNEKQILSFTSRCRLPGQPLYVYDLCLAFAKTTKEQFGYWPKVSLAMAPKVTNLDTYHFSEVSDLNHDLSREGTRIDISPSVGAWVKEWNINNFSSLVNAYTGQLILNKSFNSYFMDTFYQKGSNIPSNAVDEMARYFGIKGVVSYGKADQSERFNAESWQEITLDDAKQINYWKAPFDIGIYSLENNPKVLVIGSQKDQSYIQIFKLATQGALSYNDAILFEGKEKIDDYSESELKKFDMVILNGYSYGNKNTAMNNLDTYVKDGGSLFIDTGWQYVAKDYEIANAPGFFPAGKLTWTNIGKANQFNIDPDFGGGVDKDKISPLIWNDLPWGISSVGETSNLRNGIRPVLEANGTPIVTVGTYGKGKVSWSGFNFAAHALSFKNENEIKLLGNVWNYLLAGKTNGTTVPLNIRRSYPDVVKIEVTQDLNTPGVLYFREPNYPNWKAKLMSDGKSSNLEVYSAGPGFMAVLLPKVMNGDIIIFSFNQGFSMLFAKIISIAVFLILIVSLIIPEKMLPHPKINIKKSGILNKRIKMFNENEDEDY